jgi:S1-C subfamily serine protease
VLGIDPKGPAAQAGLIPTRVVSDGRIVVGDRIVGLGDSKIDDTSDLIAALERYIPGNTVDLLITRGGQQLRVAIALGSSS